MNAIKMLKEDHKKVKGLFREYEKAGEKAFQKKEEIARKACEELEIHARIEEEIFYPAVDEDTSKEGSKLVDEAKEEHQIVKDLIAQLKDLKVEDKEFEAKFKVLTENVEHHIEEEEGEMFPEATKKLKDQLEDLGAQMEELKKELAPV